MTAKANPTPPQRAMLAKLGERGLRVRYESIRDPRGGSHARCTLVRHEHRGYGAEPVADVFFENGSDEQAALDRLLDRAAKEIGGVAPDVPVVEDPNRIANLEAQVERLTKLIEGASGESKPSKSDPPEKPAKPGKKGDGGDE